MTTIAYRDGVLAADTSCCFGGVMLSGVIKIVKSPSGDLAGAAGNACYKTDDTLDRGVIFRKGGVIEVYEPTGVYFVHSTDYYAFGSGKSEAVGAFFAGASAETAVRAAIQHDPHTGGDVICLKHDLP